MEGYNGADAVGRNPRERHGNRVAERKITVREKFSITIQSVIAD